MGSDLSVVNAARVSFGKKSEGVLSWVAYGDKLAKPVFVPNEADTKLIHYLANHGHYSPFGHCFASFHIKAPIFVARQLVKHEYLRMNEISRRYVDSEPEFYVPDVWRGRSKDKKQGSSKETISEVWMQDYGENWKGDPSFIASAKAESDCMFYNSLIQSGVAPEMARMVLPQSMYTEWYWSGSMDAFANMCNLRLKEDTQYETRLVAQQIDKVMGELYPVSWTALVGEKK
jgi:thymidylate synthase (FAD)